MKRDLFCHPPATRRQALRLGGAGLLGAVLGESMPRLASAAQPAPIGTWLAGVSGNTAFIGITPPRTGTYAAPGEDELRGSISLRLSISTTAIH